MSHLLLFHDLARESKGMATAGENEAGNAAVDGCQEGEFPFLKVNLDVAAAEFDAIGGDELVSGSGIKAQRV